MLLSELVEDLGIRNWKAENPQIPNPSSQILSVTTDSREVEPGSLFIAVPGATSDGRDFIPKAVAAGAWAILQPAGSPKPDLPPHVTLLETETAMRELVPQLAARFYPKQPEMMVAVTGTDGKTSTAHFCRQLWERQGHLAISIGTLGLQGMRLEAGLAHRLEQNTTPGPIDLHHALHLAAAQGIRHGVMEASSHALEQRRLDAVRLQAAAFTTFSQDHLDYHPTIDAYFTAKIRLFTELLSANGIAVLALDTPRIAALAPQFRQQTITYGQDAKADLRILSYQPTATGIDAKLFIMDAIHDISLPLIGSFQLWNILAAMGLHLATGSDVANLLPHLLKLTTVPGRMEKVAVAPNGATVLLDYAHTPAALSKVLQVARAHNPSKLHVLFGCGGNRDRSKRPLMGQAATELADIAWLTDDNPRKEDADAIRREIRVGCTGPAELHEIGDRRKAIAAAIEAAGPGDILVLAGKGHETYQIIGEEKLPFDEKQIVAELLA